MNFSQYWLRFLWNGPEKRSTALWIFAFAFSVKLAGIFAGVHFFEGGFDWQYRVMSSLASQIDNPGGYWAFCAGIGVSFASVFCLAGFLDARLHSGSPRLASVSAQVFRFGALAGFAVGAERGFIHNISSMFYKSHEAIAAVAFFGVFLGILGFSACWFRRQHENFFSRGTLALLLAIAPFAGAAGSQLLIYVKFRGIGWVSPYWRELGIPVYLSFAFWQWLASLGAFLSMGVLVAIAPEKSAGNAVNNERKLAHQG